MVYDEIEYAISEEIRPQTLYVLLSREITADESVWYLDGGGQLSHSSGVAHEYEQVIVATTETHLIESGVPEISASIVNEFLKLRKLVHKAHVKFLPDGTVDIRLEEEIHKEFVTCSIANRMRALGFNEPCLAWYNFGEIWVFGSDSLLDSYAGDENRPLAPTWQSAFRWFRSNYNLNGEVKLHTGYMEDSFYKESGLPYHFVILPKHIKLISEMTKSNRLYYTPEEAQKNCLEKLCEIVEKTEIEWTYYLIS
jgi:hypothetical protein